MSLLPTFSHLPVDRQGPPLNAWGLYGRDDERGRLNLITPEAVRRGRDEIKEGIVVHLDLPLDTRPIIPSREGLKRQVIHRTYCNDDHLSFNTQGTSQWDGIKHYPYLDYPTTGQYRYYGGMTTEEAKDPQTLRLGIQNYVYKGITSRAHLLDVAAYIAKHNLPPISHFDTSTPVSLDILQACVAEAGVQFESGDILLVRTGWVDAYLALTEEERFAIASRPMAFSGVSQDEAVMRWHWDNGIAAVACDGPGYEVYPSPLRPSIHEVFIAGWGMPIGELFDLRSLAAQCDEAPRIFLEGVTTDTQGNLFMVDVPFGRVLRLDLASNEFELVAAWRGNPNGLALREDGLLVVADYREGILALDPSTGAVIDILTRRNLERFKGPNDLIVASNGDLYFTDQGQTGMTDPTGLVYRLSCNGKLDTLVSNGPSPNGLVLSPDEKILYVAMTRENSVWRLPLHKDGTTTKVSKFVSTMGAVGPDGLTVDIEGNVFICMPGHGSIYVVKPSGEPLAMIKAPSHDYPHFVTNCIFGSTTKDRKRLYFCDSVAGAICYTDWHCEGGTPIRQSKSA